MKQLIAVSQKNKQNRKSCSTLQFTGKFQILINFTTSKHKLKLTLFHGSLLMMPVGLNKKKMLP